MWKYIKNSKFYQINELGQIRRLEGEIIRSDGKKYKIKECIMKPHKTKFGYLMIELRCDLKIKDSVHRLLMETFCPVENMQNLQVNHIDGNKSNNRLDNLEWTTRKENMQHAMKNDLFHPENRFGEKHPMCKLSKDDVEKIRLLLSKNYTQHQIAIMFNVSDTTICDIKKGKTRSKG